MLTKVISGGQTGADLGGVLGARLYGLNTGGHMPLGFKNHMGSVPIFKTLFGMQEDPSPSYPPRTLLNAENSDATVRFAVDFNTAGEKCTMKCIKTAGKPNFDVLIDRNNPIVSNDEVKKFVKWLITEDVTTLNVAGNSHKTWAGMQPYVVQFLSATFFILGHDRRSLPKEYAFLAMRSYS